MSKGRLYNLLKIAVFTFLCFLFLSGCAKSDKLVLSGTIESTQLDVSSEVSGMISGIEKEEGQPVKKGDVIVVVDSGLQELSVKQQEAVVKLKKARLSELESGTRPEQIKQVSANVDSAESQLSSARAALENAKVNHDYMKEKYDNAKALYGSGSLSESEFEDARYRYDTAKQQLESARKQLESSNSQLQSVKAQLELLQNGSTNQAIEAAKADLEQSEALLEQARLLLSKYTVKAPAGGTLIYRTVNTGDMVGAGTNIGVVSDITDLWVYLYIPQKYIGKVAVNSEIELACAALHGKTIRGKITYISDQAEYTPKNIETNESKENTVFKIKVKIVDNLEALKPGMTVSSTIDTDQ